MYIMGIDLGSNTLGIAIIAIDANGDIKGISTYLLNMYHIQGRAKSGKLPRKLRYIHESIHDILSLYDPIFAMSLESPFIYHSRPAAVIPLSAIKGVIESVCYRYNPNMKITSITPSEVKTSLNIKGNSGDKNAVYEKLSKIEEISDKVDLPSLTDHEWDAITIAYSLVKLYRCQPYNFI